MGFGFCSGAHDPRNGASMAPFTPAGWDGRISGRGLPGNGRKRRLQEVGRKGSARSGGAETVMVGIPRMARGRDCPVLGPFRP